MTEAQKKAQELIKMFRPFVKTWDWYWDAPLLESTIIANCKKCAIIAVELLIKHCPSDNGNPPNLPTYSGNKEFWQSVKAELTKQ